MNPLIRAFDIVIGLTGYLLPVLLAPMIYLLHQSVFKERKRKLIYPALLFFACGILIVQFRYWTSEEASPSDFARRYERGMGIIKQTLPELEKDPKNELVLNKLAGELQYLAESSDNNFIDTRRFLDFLELATEGKTKTLVEEIEKTYANYIEMADRIYRNRPFWKKIGGPFLLIGFFLVLYSLFALARETIKEKKKAE